MTCEKNIALDQVAAASARRERAGSLPERGERMKEVGRRNCDAIEAGATLEEVLRAMKKGKKTALK